MPIQIGGDGLAVAMCPTVHGGDVLTVAENTTSLPDVVATARGLFPGHDVAVSPLTLRLGPEPDADVYDHAALAWCVASLDMLSRSGVSSVTLGSDVLPAAGAGMAGIGAASSAVLQLLAQAARAPAISLRGDPHQLLHAIEWEVAGSGERQLLLANMADHPQRVATPTIAIGDTPVSSEVIWAPLGEGSVGDASVGDGASDNGSSDDVVVVPGFGIAHARMEK